MSRFLHVRLGRTWLGLPAEEVDEISALPEVTPLPGGPPYLAGVVAVDGRLVTVLDPVDAWSLGRDDAPARRLVRLADATDPLALVAAEVRGVVEGGEVVDEALTGHDDLRQRTQSVRRCDGLLTWVLAPGALRSWILELPS